MSNEVTRAPIAVILSATMPVTLERGLPGYAADTLCRGEIRLKVTDQRSLLFAGVFLGVLNACATIKIDLERVRTRLRASANAIPGLTPEEISRGIKLVNQFENYPIIRAEHAFDDWITEALWKNFQPNPYVYPSAMSGLILHGLRVQQILVRCRLEYDG